MHRLLLFDCKGLADTQVSQFEFYFHGDEPVSLTILSCVRLVFLAFWEQIVWDQISFLRKRTHFFEERKPESTLASVVSAKLETEPECRESALKILAYQIICLWFPRKAGRILWRHKTWTQKNAIDIFFFRHRSESVFRWLICRESNTCKDLFLLDILIPPGVSSFWTLIRPKQGKKCSQQRLRQRAQSDAVHFTHVIWTNIRRHSSWSEVNLLLVNSFCI